MNRWKRHIPEGVQDYLPGEYYNKRWVEEVIRKVFFYSGYDEIESPVFEYLDVFVGDKAYIKQEQMLKIVEAGSRILVMRPDVTMPIARIAATKLRKAPLPIRLSYISDVYRYQEPWLGKQRQIAQAGTELIGLEGPEADAETISTVIQCFLDLGLKDFQIDIGQVEFFKGLVDEAGLDSKSSEQLRLLIEQKNLLALESLLEEIPLKAEIKELFLNLPKMYGSIDILEKGALYTGNNRCIKAIENIREVYEILKDYGLEKYITFDLGMIYSLNYYTGIIFRVFTKDLGFPLCGGGRYDKLLSEFGYDVPATGFAIDIKRLLIALDRQGGLKTLPNTDILLVLDKKNRQEGYKLSDQLKKEGKRVEIFFSTHNNKSPQEYAESKGISEVIFL
ncbi:MAG: ATP phosphoribosyltransferase regulatory subunit [Clostridiales bacterium]|nr:ATP phosphoribosyltransferase regulatory subunit [Clostridiales bacterium]